MELEREQAPELFDLIHEVTTALNGPKVHHVLLSDEFNASIVQIPQFGMFGLATKRHKRHKEDLLFQRFLFQSFVPFVPFRGLA